MQDLASKTPDELCALAVELGAPGYCGKQIFSWLHKGVPPVDMTNISKVMRQKLCDLPLGGAKILETQVSAKDGTRKYLFSLDDGQLVEGVLMRYSYGNTLCISTQVGCRMGCSFCASTIGGLVRNMSAGEMLSCLAAVNRETCESPSRRGVTNIVLMGMGEPLDNYENTVRFLKNVSHPDGINISPRNISLSTCGIVERMSTLPADAPHVTLSVSLHAPNGDIRRRIMRVARSYSYNEVLYAARQYAQATGRRVIFEYALIDGVNASHEDACELAMRLRGMNAHVNLIPLNDVAETGLRGVDRPRAAEFMQALTSRSISATIRREMGSDIDGACGQLRKKRLV